ncbi:MAG: nitroreductase family protein [Candidatus Izemoplasmatales bacterium]
MEFFESLKIRRSNYNIDKNILVSKEEVLDVIGNAVKYTPSAFNSESQRVMVLLNDNHDKLWEIVKQEIKKIVSEVDFKKSEDKINTFKSGYGTVLFFDDDLTTKSLIEKFPLYKENFKRWATEQNGMLQSNVWVGLGTIGLGGSLQHYNELIEETIKKEFKIDESWSLKAQMPFGNIVEVAQEKEKKDLDLRMIVLE